ncbi:MAG TPA: AMP-binding protein, partial [Spirochaetota bacterium]|nr:AMP-binding protein [Spirochaetota bacterium]
KPTAKYLLPDLAEIKPTYMVSVPRIWESVYNGVLNNIKKESPIKRGLFYFFTGVGKNYTYFKKLLVGHIPYFKKKNPIVLLFEKIISIFMIIFLFVPNGLGSLLVFSKIRKKTGGKVRGLISGGGALPEYVDKFFSSIGIHILEGYGLTETAPIISVRNFKTLVYRTVGRPAPGVEVMIGDENWNRLPNQSEKGIIYIKGDLVMAGYYKNPEKTNEILKNGWLNTGDLGRLTISGEIQITGRAKDTIVLIGGENVEPEPIENKLLEEPLISQVIVVGQDKKTLGALIIPQKENLEDLAKHKGINFNNYEELCKKNEIIEEFSKLIKNKINTTNGFKSYEKIISFTLLTTPFEVGKELTLSLKMKRNVIMEKYHTVIEEMYSGLM